MKHLIVGTAGHVDHGKTALIRALTGTDTDRLKEEKRRGISIDIGFAALRFDDGVTLGIIDVPGHERYLKNMLAGTGAIDLVMLVIAADEGIMPQTREHFEMLQCLGIKHGIIVMNKTDKVDAEWLHLVEEDVRLYLSETFLAKAPICRVSAITGSGLDALKSELHQQALKIHERDSGAPFRLWIDRAFSLKGQGLIVTGTVLSGQLRKGETITVYPSGMIGKVRELENHHEAVDSVKAGQRASVNLGGPALGQVCRGMFLSVSDYGRTSKVWKASVLWKNKFPSGTRVRFHIGTGEFIGRMSYSKEEHESDLIRLYLEEPVSAGIGDRGILRRYSPQDLIGGVTLLVPVEHSRNDDRQVIRLKEALSFKEPKRILLEVLGLAKAPPTQKEWTRAAGFLNEKAVHNAIEELVCDRSVRIAGSYYITNLQVSAYQTLMQKVLAEFHRIHPGEVGISREILRQKIKLPAVVSDWFFQESENSGLAVLKDEWVAAPAHAEEHKDSVAGLKMKFETHMKTEELVDVTPQWLAEKLGLRANEGKAAFDTLVREGLITRIAGVHVYRKTIQYIGAVIQKHFATHETLTVAELRDLLHTSRRLTIPVMEYFDSHNYTRRKGDERLAGANITKLSE